MPVFLIRLVKFIITTYSSFLGVAALLINDRFDKSLVILGLNQMEEGHTAEKTKDAIENMINKYKFDKRKIRGKYAILYLW